MAGTVPMGALFFPTTMGTTVYLCPAVERAVFFHSKPAGCTLDSQSFSPKACVGFAPPSCSDHVFIMLQGQGLCLRVLFVPSVLQIDA